VDDDSNLLWWNNSTMNNSTIVDQGTDGFDNKPNNLVANNLVDDALERETSPPYPVPLRGIEIRIRCYEPSSRQVRQVTVRHTFVPH
jgi:curli biogenesis system outer membrane secretion channel CsgG